MCVTSNRNGRTNATPVEKDFVAALARRFRRVRGLVRQTVGYPTDALELGGAVDGPGGRRLPLEANDEDEIDDAARERFDFETDPELTDKFIAWLKQQVRQRILEPATPGEVEEGKHWTARYIDAAARAGIDQSAGLLFQQGASVDMSERDQLLRRPIFASSLRQLYTRTYTTLETVTDETAPAVRSILTEGFREGINPREMAEQLTEQIRDIQHTRAETLARSETINAHSTATLDNYERAGVGVVSHGEWAATNDTRTCPFCERLDDAELTLDEMRSAVVLFRGQQYRLQPPAHPNGRCAVLPVVGADEPSSPLQERVPGRVIST